MGKLGRIACIATPMALTIASLICLLFIFLAGLNKSDSALTELYFFKVNYAYSLHECTPVLDLLLTITLRLTLRSSRTMSPTPVPSSTTPTSTHPYSPPSKPRCKRSKSKTTMTSTYGTSARVRPATSSQHSARRARQNSTSTRSPSGASTARRWKRCYRRSSQTA